MNLRERKESYSFSYPLRISSCNLPPFFCSVSLYIRIYPYTKPLYIFLMCTYLYFIYIILLWLYIFFLYVHIQLHKHIYIRVQKFKLQSRLTMPFFTQKYRNVTKCREEGNAQIKYRATDDSIVRVILFFTILQCIHTCIHALLLPRRENFHLIYSHILPHFIFSKFKKNNSTKVLEF